MTDRVPKDTREAVVWVDGSFREGRGGVGMSGAFGNRARVVRVADCTEAELAAIAWGLGVAADLKVPALVIRSDFVGNGYLAHFVRRKKHRELAKLLAVAIHKALNTHPRWSVLDASAREVKAAHRLARRASAPFAPRELIEPLDPEAPR